MTGADVSDSRQIREALEAVHSTFGPVELLINNAAVVWPLGPTERLDSAPVNAALAVNAAAAIELPGAVLPAMAQTGWGQIINVSSGIVANPKGMVGGTVSRGHQGGA